MILILRFTLAASIVATFGASQEISINRAEEIASQHKILAQYEHEQRLVGYLNSKGVRF